MPHEIERKFIVVNQQWKQMADAKATEDIVQGYVRSPDSTVRVRISTNVASGKKEAFLTLKTKRNISYDTAIDRREWEYSIPVEHAQDMLDHLCDSKIKKRRYHLMHEGKEWTIDDFTKPKYHGLKLAEIELESPREHFELPPFVTLKSEVTRDNRFTSGYMSGCNADDLSFLKKEIAKATAAPHR
jgi:CYTH domain-containing protein